MMTRELEVSILSAPLAAIDRRTLSQAWYSALHVARQKAPAQCLAPRPGYSSENAPAGRSAVVRSGDKAMPVPTPSTAQRSRTIAPPSGVASDGATTQRGRSALSRRIELRFAGNPAPVARATFSFGAGAARVHVIMQSNGSATRLVAICRPQMREIVARALAETRLALNARGTILLTKSMFDFPATTLATEPCS
jgi:hypothetical protein